MAVDYSAKDAAPPPTVRSPSTVSLEYGQKTPDAIPHPGLVGWPPGCGRHTPMLPHALAKGPPPWLP